MTWSTLKAFADNKLEMGGMFEFPLDRVENIVEKDENFTSISTFPGSQKPGIV